MGSGCAWVTQMTDDLDRLVLDFLRQLNHNVLEHFEFNEKLPSKNNLTKTMSCQLYYVCGFFFFLVTVSLDHMWHVRNIRSSIIAGYSKSVHDHVHVSLVLRCRGEAVRRGIFLGRSVLTAQTGWNWRRK